MRPAERIIEKFGGLSVLSQALGHKHPTTVQGWKERGFIPARQQAEVMAAAVKEGVDLSPMDFIESSIEPTPTATTAGTEKTA